MTRCPSISLFCTIIPLQVDYLTDDVVEGEPLEEYERYSSSFSGLPSATVFEHVDRIVASVLMACDQYEWAREFLLPVAFYWIRLVKVGTVS